jgi:hypothetical protein
MRLFSLLRFFSTRPTPPWRESPPLVPAQSPPFRIMVDLRELRDELKLPHVTTELSRLI